MPCNNDLLAANFIDDGERLWVIDYEYAGNNDPCFELGNIWSESDLAARPPHGAGRQLLRRGTCGNKVARARLLGLMSKYGWTLWASIQAAVSPIEFDFWSWGMEKYDRAVEEFDGPGFAAAARRGAPPRLTDRSVGAPRRRLRSSNVWTTAGSMVCFGPVNHFFAETSHQIVSRSRAPSGDDRRVVDELPRRSRR